MLRLENVEKVYRLPDSETHALRGISISFRRNEFVSILGPSGCGKTTTLNIVGGLDHASGGDLFINGVSTKDFTDKDWDVYRNRRIGFIFQSYNLIPQENIQENVELALAISGMKKAERAKLAQEALDKVGLKGLYKKYPNQLSGGQSQRVAIARAIVNQPDILLADEPTGALDSETSTQIMDLIKEISKEKLVIMVTHNPDIAQKYSTRIVNLLDGQIESDTNPYSAEEEIEESKASREKEAEELASSTAKMSWLTAFKLSAKNLWVKKKRTILTIIASSIGIVGVSAVLAVSSGVRGYIASMQDDMLSGNPITIAESGADLTSLLSSTSTTQQAEAISEAYKDGKIDIQFALKTLVNLSGSMSSAAFSNPIDEDYVEFIDDMPSSYYAALGKKYGINIKNNLYTHTKVNLQDAEETDRYSIAGITAFCTSILESARGGAYSSYASMVDTYSNAIGQSLDNEEYVLSQYDVVEGHYATSEDEVMLVLNHQNEMTEIVLTLLGYYSQDEFQNAIYHFAEDKERFDPAMWEKQQSRSLSELIGKEYYYYPNDSIFKYNAQYGPTDNTQDAVTKPQLFRPFDYAYLDDGTLEKGMKIKVAGILTPKETVSYGCYSSGLYFTPALAKKYLKDNLDSDVARWIRGEEDEATHWVKNKNPGSFSSMIMKVSDTMNLVTGITYKYNLRFEDSWIQGIGLVGTTNAMQGLSSLIGSIGGSGSGGSTRAASLTTRHVGGNAVPSSIAIYPTNFETKHLVTEYLDTWNQPGDIVLSSGKIIPYETKVPENEDTSSSSAESAVSPLNLAERPAFYADAPTVKRPEIKYSDDLQLIITMINGVIDIVTIALIAFTALALVVSTVMIGIITYVSVMERVKEIGVIRSLGGRKNDVSNLFIAETFMIGGMSGIFGIAMTYVFELVLNLTVGVTFKLGMIANLSVLTALLVILVSILLTMIAGLTPARSASRQDPVVALRSE